MKFCNNCNNMLYIKVEDQDLAYFCKNCNFKMLDNSTESKCIMETSLDEDLSNYKQFITPFIKYDKTLPRVNNIRCANHECTRQQDEDQQVIYIKFNQTKMTYLYYCCHCEHFWKSNDNKK